MFNNCLKVKGLCNLIQLDTTKLYNCTFVQLGFKSKASVARYNKIKETSKIALYFHLIEIRYRFFYFIFSFLMTFLLSYFYSFELIYLFVSSFFGDKNFIFTDLTEGLSITLRISFICTLILLIPYSYYQLWCFFIPSVFKKEKKKIKIFSFFFFLLFFLGIYFINFLILPKLSEFLFTFEIKKELLTIQLEPRIHSYLRFIINISFFFLFLFQTPLLFAIFFLFNLLTPIGLSRIRKYFLFTSILIAAIISPPDILTELCLALFFLFIYEISIWIGFLFQEKKLCSTNLFYN